MRRSMLGGAIALMMMGTPATRAMAIDGDDALRVIAGAVALGVIANKLSKSQGEAAATEVDHRVRRFDDDRRWGYEEPRTLGWRMRDGGKWHKRRNARVLPERCLTTFRTNRGTRAGLSGQCLRREGVRVDRLPDRCERRVQTRHGVRTVYALRCLDRQGYRISRRR